jgi:uncharacterized membrane protein YdfJ with MMPL/SSD domain
VLVQAPPGGSVTSPQGRAALSDVVRALRRFPQIEAIRAPTSNTSGSLVSPDRRSSLVLFALSDYVPIDRVQAAVADVQHRHPDLMITETGDISASTARDATVHRDLHRAELLSVPVTLVVLLLAFGALVAAGVPLMLGVSAVVAGVSLLGVLSRLTPIDSSTKTVVVLIGLAVGVDYSLFYLVRAREERRRGKPAREALVVAAHTSGRAIAVSGVTVMVAMAGLYVVRSDVFSGIATGTITVVAAAIAGSLTALPALLSLLGDRADRGHLPLLGRHGSGGFGSRLWPWLVGMVLRRPLAWAAGSVALLLALATPALQLHVSKPSDDALAVQSTPALRTLSEARDLFPAASEPAQVVVIGASGRAGVVGAAGREHVRRTLAAGIAHRPIIYSGNSGHSGEVITLPLAGSGSNATSYNALHQLRTQLVPQTLGRISGVRTAVTGATAEDVDFSGQMRHAVPYVIAFVLAFALLLLLVTFRSIVVPIKAIVLNLLSVGASYGLLVLVFQHHWAEGILGFRSDGAIIAWLPLFLFVILFGLSMDYHVFILSRIGEAHDRGLPSDQAVREAISSTASVVTSAALVMVAVFSIFGTLSSLDIKQAGVGLAVAVLLDATVIRGVLLPASMSLLGDWNWYLPNWLGWIPTLRHEVPTRPISAPHGRPDEHE